MLHTKQILLLHAATLQQGKGKEEVYLVQGAVWLTSLRGQCEASGGADGGLVARVGCGRKKEKLAWWFLSSTRG